MANEFLLAGQFKRFTRLHKRFMENFLKDYDITYEQYYYLIKMRDSPNCNQNYLCDFFNSKKSLISNTLRDLEDKEFINQVIDPDNRRSYIINITPKAEKVIKELRDIDKEWENNFYNFSKDSEEDIKKNLIDVYNKLDQMIK